MRQSPGARFAIIVPAHNEEIVIGKLVDNLINLEYPRSLYDVYVIADNCNDATARVARERGAIVWERSNRNQRGKGFVLNYALTRLGLINGEQKTVYNAVVIFDADNLVATNFLQAMNKRLQMGEKIIQSFIDSKNPNDSWVASAFSFTFWINNRFALQARHKLGFNTALAGTGMCISIEVLQVVGWSTLTLTEDLEFSIQALLKGYRTTFAPETRIYDEKAVDFFSSFHQSLRWTRGQIHTAFIYFPRLLWQGIIRRDVVKLEAGLRLIHPFVVVMIAVKMIAFVAHPDLFRDISLYYMLVQPCPILSLFFLVYPFLLPLVIIYLERLPWSSIRYLPFYPFFILSMIPMVLIAFFYMAKPTVDAYSAYPRFRPPPPNFRQNQGKRLEVKKGLELTS